MATTALEIIEDSLIELGAKDPLVPLKAHEVLFALRKLNELLESWSNEALLVYQIQQDGNLAVVSGTASYVIGTGSTWNVERPLRIESAFLRDGPHDYPVEVVTRVVYDRQQIKTTSARPHMLYYESAAPSGTVFLYPTPDSSSYKVFLNSYKILPSFATAGSAVVLPKGYLRALKKNLPIELAPSRQKAVGQLLLMAARESKDAIRLINRRVGSVLDCFGYLDGDRRLQGGRADFYGGS